MDLFISDADRRRRLTATIYGQLRDAIATGRVRPGDRLPSSRALATELDVSRHTVTTVYGRLVAEGYLEGAAGGGTRVAADPFPHGPDGETPIGDVRMRPSLRALVPLHLGPGGPFDLRLGTPDPRFFPADDWRRRMTRELRAVADGPTGPEGDSGLVAGGVGRSGEQAGELSSSSGNVDRSVDRSAERASDSRAGVVGGGRSRGLADELQVFSSDADRSAESADVSRGGVGDVDRSARPSSAAGSGAGGAGRSTDRAGDRRPLDRGVGRSGGGLLRSDVAGVGDDTVEGLVTELGQGDGSGWTSVRADVAPGYRDPAGEPVLRAAIAAWIERSRGVRATGERVIVTAGAQQAFDLILTALIEPGDVVAVEDPGYPRFRDLARLRGAEVVGVPVDAEGLVVEALPDAARLVHVTPSHQFPLGSVMSLPRRRSLLRWARIHDAAVIEDDYDSEFRFTGRPLEPLHLLDDDGRVIYVATFSKTLSPMLRLGFLVAPESLVTGLGALRQLLDWHGEPVAQRALAGFLDDGAMARHVHRARRRYAARRDVVLRHAAGDLGRLGQLVPSAAGLHVALELHGDTDESAVLARARAVGIEIDGLSQYAVSTATRPGLAISYGTAAPDQLEEALTRLARC